ncbi:MAG: methyltransferase [Actinobacteria bacterium]|nr:methyltransferase [Actinomycetota bacterium]
MPSPSEPSHYFDPAPSVGSRRRTVDLVLPEGRLVTLITDQGVFSGDHVDPGTRLLIATAPPLDDARTLVDVGCGYGPIAITMALRAAEDATVWAVDVNERARVLCAENAEANGVGARVRVVAPEEVPDDLVADVVWSNPPIRIGKPALHALLTGWFDRLAPDGTAVLVVQRNLGADSLARWIGEGGRPVVRLASRAGYRVLTVGGGDP